MYKRQIIGVAGGIGHGVWLLLLHVVQQQRNQIFVVPKPAVQHSSTCLKLFSGISRYRILVDDIAGNGGGLRI